VTIEDSNSGDEHTYTIVGEDESDLKRGRISVQSPIARALIGKSIGEETRFQTPGGEREVEIIDVQWLAVED
jgi:transcription elongation factor GreA